VECTHYSTIIVTVHNIAHKILNLIIISGFIAEGWINIYMTDTIKE